MDKLKNFAKNKFSEQILILQEIEANNQKDAIPDLIRLCKSNLDDNDPVQYMINTTLLKLLPQSQEYSIEGLSSGNPVVQKICMQVCSEKKFTAAVPILMNLSKTNTDHRMQFEILSSLSKIESPEILEFFQPYMKNSSPLIAALAIEVIGRFKDSNSVLILCQIIEEAESDENYKVCDLTTHKAIESLGQIKNEKSISFLASKIHHRNPTARRFIHKELVKLGTDVISYIEPFFNQDNIDNKIMASNLLGMIGGRQAVSILVNAIDNGLATHHNVKFAIYESLGKIPSMKGFICLMDGLSDPDELILLPVTNSLNSQVNQGVIDKFKEIILSKTEQSDKVLNAVIRAKAFNIFMQLYEDSQIGELLINNILKTKDGHIIYSFTEKLKTIKSHKSNEDIKKLSTAIPQKLTKKVLAVDDSNPMLLFYRSIMAEIGVRIRVAENGQQALDILEKEEPFDLILTDMNMPVMDGIEFSRKVRENLFWEAIPIIMSTTESEASQTNLAKQAGVTDFITKPFKAETLKEKIQLLLGI
ncbi:MAG: response regulator [Desulfobacterales bacterium]|nr:response regulator [Desulfobacterales bacterium]MBF0395376.1 response regulator [Desulfobacterales bacterium]